MFGGFKNSAASYVVFIENKSKIYSSEIIIHMCMFQKSF